MENKPKCLYHLCKLSADGSIIFYSLSDFLVFATVVFTYAERYGITITAFCIMLNHFHIAAYADSREMAVRFYKIVCSMFARMYNRREGKVKIKWKNQSNISEKYSIKKKKSLYIYITNNASCKKCCSKASEYKWVFLNSYPEEKKKIKLDFDERKQLKLAKALVRNARKKNRPLSYEFFDHFSAVLSPQGQTILAEYVISTYTTIDYSDIISLFGSLENFLFTADVTSGSEYDTEEDLTMEDYRHYRKMISVLKRFGLEGNDVSIHQPDFNLWHIIYLLRSETNASNAEISRFLHCPLGN